MAPVSHGQEYCRQPDQGGEGSCHAEGGQAAANPTDLTAAAAGEQDRQDRPQGPEQQDCPGKDHQQMPPDAFG